MGESASAGSPISGLFFMPLLRIAIPVSALIFTLVAGLTDLRWRRIPNWWTVPGALVGLALNIGAYGWAGLKASLLGCGLGLLLLVPFFALRAIGGGDCKLVAAMGAFVGPGELLQLLVVAVLVNGGLALIFIVAKGRGWKTLKNMGLLLVSLAQFRLPPRSMTLDDPDAIKVPFGVAFALAAAGLMGAQLVTGWKTP